VREGGWERRTVKEGEEGKDEEEKKKTGKWPRNSLAA
jgi:hypothetical protein